MRQVAGSGKRLTLELGGKAANIVFDDAPIDQTVEGIVAGIFFNQGHVCCAGSRLLVQESVADELVARLNMLAAEIPAMRERMLRQHLYTLRDEKTPKRWLDIFRKKAPEEEMQTLAMLREVVQSMLSQNKISRNEALKLMAYAETLHSD